MLAIQAMIGAGFLAFTLLTSNPFARVWPPPLDGAGLNPLLQDPGLAFHPPLLYFGYVGLSVAFSFAVAALLEGRVDRAWARWVRPWTLAAWAGLTAGIALGSWWAYYELGWGGFWFWDPVENASFMPWLAATALLHSAIAAERREALRSWTVLLAIVAFSLSLLGTFLVRSGVLTSVHAFATDPERGVFILLLLGIATGGALALYAWRAPALGMGAPFRPVSREGALLLNNLVLVTACATVLLGTLYPLFLDALDAGKVSVGPPYFAATFVPLIAPALVAMAVGPMLAWKRGDLAGALGRLWMAGLGAALAAGATLAYGETLAALGLAAAAWIGIGALVEWAERLQLGRTPAGESMAARAFHAPRRLGRRPGASGRRHRRRRHHGISGLPVRTHPGDETRRQRPDRRLHDPLRWRRPRRGTELPGRARDARGSPGRRADGRALPRKALLSRRTPAHDGSRDPHHIPRRPLRSDRRRRRGGRPHGAPLPQPAGAVDLDRRDRHVPRRAGFAQRPPIAACGAGAPATTAAA